MSFRIAARTILHLGAELISSDGIALYELIKNAYDARSPNIRIDVQATVERRAQRDLLQAFRTAPDAAEWQLRKADILLAIHDASPLAAQTRRAVSACRSLAELVDIVQEANSIVLRDEGKGMSLEQLDEAFLTIGTRSKLKLALDPDEDPVLGEKGIGRLSAMRLGSRLKVRTSAQATATCSELEIDWAAFDHDSEQLVDAIPLAPRAAGVREPKEKPGTTLSIRGLNREWSWSHIEEIARHDFARINDPFENTPRFPILVTHNGRSVPIPRIEPWVFEHAQAHCEGTFRTLSDGKLIFSGRMSYRGKQDVFAYDEAKLLSVSDATSVDVLRMIGGFSVEFYWFNRKYLTALEGVGDLGEVRKRLALWTGGLMLFRDGFRVLPYGGPDDDWLGLDRKALARGGFKLNRQQIVGRVLITKKDNPQLKDQANREGLIDNEEKRALQELLSHLVQQTVWSFLNQVERQTEPPREPVREEVINARLTNEEERLERNLKLLIERVPAVRSEREILAEMRDSVDSFRDVMDQVRQLAREYEDGRTQLLNLAGVGLTVEILAHELNRTAETALDTIARLPSAELSRAVDAAMRGLGTQLKTLQKRLRVLDPLSTSGRNRKEKVELSALLRDVLLSHREHFQAEGISSAFVVEPEAEARVTLTLVRGMIVQIMENLISNSVYWLRQAKRLDPDFSPRIEVVLDTQGREIRFSDNGPGISAEDAPKVFDAFFTNRPAGGGKGLGLFISREIAKYHGAGLDLVPGDDGVLRTFVVSFEGVR